MKNKIITSVSICLVVAAIVLGIVVFRTKTGSSEVSRVRIMGEPVSEETDVLLDQSGTHGYVHGVWGFGRNLSERSNILEQEPGCGVRIGNEKNENLQILTFGKLARVMEQERDTSEESEHDNLFSAYPVLEKIEVEEGNPYLKSEQGMLYEIEPGSGSIRSLYACIIGKKGAVKIAEGTRVLREGAFQGCNQITSVNIPESVEEIYPDALKSMDLCTEFTVDEANPYYCSVDGVLYTKDRKKQVAYPEGKKNER